MIFKTKPGKLKQLKEFLYILMICLLFISCKAKLESVASEPISSPITELQVVVFSPSTSFGNFVTDKKLLRKMHKVFAKESQTKLMTEMIELPSEDNSKVSLEDTEEDDNGIAEKLTALVNDKNLDYIMYFEPIKYRATSGNGNSLLITYDISLIDLNKEKRVWRTKHPIYIYGGYPSAKSSCEALVKQWKKDGIIL